MTDSAPVSKVAFLGDYPPRQCGIATFTRDLREAVAEANPDEQRLPADLLRRAESALQASRENGGDRCTGGAAAGAAAPTQKSALAQLRDLLPRKKKDSDLKRRTD